MSAQQKIAIIGAGLSGLTAGHFLRAGFDVKIFDKARGVSGRMATRYTAAHEFDHGAQSFTARSQTFKTFLASFIAAGHVAIWPDADIGDPRYVAVPRMNALGKQIAQNLNVTLGCRITKLTRQGQGWILSAESGEAFGPFDQVICAVPAPQALDLLPVEFSAYEQLSGAKMLPAFTVMAGLSEPWPLGWTYKRFKDSPICQVSVNNSKPGRPQASGASLVIQADNGWAGRHITLNKQIVLTQLAEAFERLTGVDITPAPHLVIHRWLYANVGQSATGEAGYLIDRDLGLAACGDWAIAGRVEAAFISGYDLANALMNAPIDA